MNSAMNSSSNVKRADRIANRIQAELEAMIHKGVIRDPRIEGLWISGVRVTDDLKHAFVLLRLVDTDPVESKKKSVVDAMTNAQKFIRREMATRLKLRYAPQFRFEWDKGYDHALRMDSIFDEMDASRDKTNHDEN